jgi:hypothetical protein
LLFNFGANYYTKSNVNSYFVLQNRTPYGLKAQSFYGFKSNSDPDHDGGGQIIQCFANAHCHDIA